MNYRHAAVWLDHNEARIFHITEETFEEATVESPRAHTHLHRKTGPGAVSGRRASEDPHYYRDVAQALKDVEEILVVGPATAKLELIRYIHAHERALEPRIVGVETVDHPSDRQLVAYARRYFDAADRMRGN